LTETTFMPPSPLNTAVLFLVFNRPDTTRQVFRAIRKAKPPRLYVAADGPRANCEGEEEKVKAVRKYVMDNIDWDCEVKTLFRDENLGCKYAVSGAITWFFEHEEMGIILEDDCLPSQSFFWFCEELLDKYKDDQRVMQINGSCLLSNLNLEESYFFSKYNHIWGWASWRRAWAKFSLSIDNFNSDFMQISGLFNSKNEQRYWYNIFFKYYTGQIDTWDYPWTFSVWKNNGLSANPKNNMILNIGFNKDATHTKGKNRFSKLTMQDLTIVKHPKEVVANYKLDIKCFKTAFAQLITLRRIAGLIKRKITNLKDKK
jgi:hypothetical protein